MKCAAFRVKKRIFLFFGGEEKVSFGGQRSGKGEISKKMIGLLMQLLRRNTVWLLASKVPNFFFQAVKILRRHVSNRSTCRDGDLIKGSVGDLGAHHSGRLASRSFL